MELNKLYLGDCIEVMKGFPDNIIDLTVTSPPYDNLRTYNGSLVWNEDVWKAVLQQLYRVTKQGGVVVWVVGDATIKGSETGTSFKQALYAKEIGFNLHDTMIWRKTSFNHDPRNGRYKQYFEYMLVFSAGKPKIYNEIKDVPCKYSGKTSSNSKRLPNGEMRRYGKIKISDFQARSNIWAISQTTITQHPAPFPLQLAKDHIYSWSNEGDLVLDPFMGSGTTAVAAIELNRKYIGIEEVEEYCKIANARIQNAINKKGLFSEVV